MGLLKEEDLPQDAEQNTTKERKIVRVQASGKNDQPIPAPAVSTPAEPVADTPEKKPLFGRPRQGTGSTSRAKPRRQARSANKISDFERAAKNAPPIKIPLKYRLRPDAGLLRRATWDVASIISLLFNAVLLTVVILLGMQVKTLKSTVNNLVGGLYDNFVALDEAVISTTLTLPEMYIPLNFSLNVNQPSTNVTLTENVTIRNAHVVINTDAIKINSTATVTLPVGTILPVSLNMDVPVQTTIPVNLSIPVVIQLAASNPSGDQQMGLHDAFVGLQNTLGPIYCLLNPDVVDGSNYICQQGDYLPKQVNP